MATKKKAQQDRDDALFDSAFKHATIGMALVAPDGSWLKVNPALCKLFGHSETQLLKTNFHALTHPDDLEGVSLVPLDIHFNERGRAKVLLGVGEGRQKQDKRAAIADRDWKRDKARLMAHTTKRRD